MTLRKVYGFDIDCANCARKVEDAIRGIDGVNSVSLSFIDRKMFVDIPDERFDGIMEEVRRVSRSVEDGFRFWPLDEEKEEEPEEENGRWLVPRIVIGAVFMVLGLFMEYGMSEPPADDTVLRAVYLAILLSVGYNIFLSAARNLVRGGFLDEHFLMGISTVGAVAVGYWTESVAVMVFYLVGEWFEDRAVDKTRRDVKALMGLKVSSATVLRGGKAVKVDPSDVRVGEGVVVGPGETFPLDGTVVGGEGFADTKAMTGESVPRHIAPGDKVLSGFINADASVTVRTDRPFKDSAAKRMLELIEESSARKSRSEKFITRFARYYTPAVVVSALALAAVPSVFEPDSAMEWIYRAMIFLVVACPCALVISVPLTYFCGIGGASRRGILIKGGSYIEALSKVDKVVFDKTGTLSKGEFTVNEVEAADGYAREDIVDLAACAEAFSSHPIAHSILSYYGKDIDPSRIQGSVNVPGKGVAAEVDDRPVFVGSYALMRDNGVVCEEHRDVSGTDVYVAVNGKYAGHILISDIPKEDSRAAVSALRDDGVRTYMFTGDILPVAESMSRELGLDDFAAEMLPEDKTISLEKVMVTSRGTTAFVGDGINDAPSLARADVGIAMGGLGSDAAIEAADVVILNDSPVKVAESRKLAKKTQGIVVQNIVLALSVKFLILGLTPFGITNMWAAIFGDVGVLVLCILNATRALGRPEKAPAGDHAHGCSCGGCEGR